MDKQNQQQEETKREFGGFNSDAKAEKEMKEDRQPKKNEEADEEDTETTPQNFQR